MAKQELSIPALMNKVPTEADAYLLLESLRWADGVVCPHCASVAKHYFLQPKDGTTLRKTRTGSLSQRRVWKCKDCRKQFSVLTGTIFHGTKISVRTWLFVIFEMCASKNGVSAREIERKYDLTAKTAWFMTHRIREAMKREPLAGLLRGTVVSDETWIGGKPANKPLSKRPKRGPMEWPNAHSGDKTPVLALVNTDTGEVRSQVVPDVTGATLSKLIHEQVDVPSSVLHTDEWKGYRPVGQEFLAHHRTNHSVKQYVGKTGGTTNPAEGYFSQLKRSLDGTHHAVSVEHLPRYLAEFDFRHTTRDMDDTERMLRVVRQVTGRRLSYRPLTGQD
jgi:transposase-like protein